MLSKFLRQSRQHRIFVKSISLVAIAVVGLALMIYRPAPASSASLIDRLEMLRSTSPESGVYDTRSTSFDVAVIDTMVSDLQTLTEDCALAIQSTDPELSESAISWHEKLEEPMPKLQQTRRDLVARRFAELKSTSPESGIE